MRLCVSGSPFNFSGLSNAEVVGYIRHKIACAGDAETIIDLAALSAVHSHSQGNPRGIDNLMTDTLVLGAQLDKKVIDPELILSAVSGQNLMRSLIPLGSLFKHSKYIRRRYFLVAFMIISG